MRLVANPEQGAALAPGDAPTFLFCVSLLAKDFGSSSRVEAIIGVDHSHPVPMLNGYQPALGGNVPPTRFPL